MILKGLGLLCVFLYFIKCLSLNIYCVFFFFFSVEKDKHVLNICYGGTFIVDHDQTSYIGGYKFDMEVDINMILPSVLQRHLHGLMGNISVEKVRFGNPKKSLAHGLILLYEGTYDIFLEILKKEKGVEIYLEHNLDKIRY